MATYIRWPTVGTGTITIGAFGSTPNAFGMSASGATINLQPADATHPGGLLAADWVTFNSKQAAGNYITALTGDVTASGPGSSAATLATVNSNVGSFTYASLTVNAKGLVTAASSGAAPEVPLTFSTGLTRTVNTVTVNTSQNIATLSNLTTNGFVKTGGGVGTLSVDTSTYLTGNQTITLSGDVSGSGSTAITATLANVVSASTNTKITYNAKGLVTAGAAATLASADFANQGTTTTVLHGNAAGNPSFGAIVNADITNSTIDLTTKVTGALPLVNGGTGTAAASANAAFNALSPLTTKGDVLGYSTVNARLAVGSNGQVLSADSTQTTGLKWVSASGTTAPTIQKFTTGSGTYTTPTSPAALYIEVELVGAGGGGAGNAGVGNNGGNTTFGSSLLVGNGGVGGTATAPSQGGAGGTASLGSGPVGTAISGASGGGGTNTPGSAGGNGGASQFGGAGGGGAGNAGGGGIGLNAAANTGSGGGAGGSGAGGSNGGGGSGGYVRAFIYTPSATYSYAIGAKGTGSGSGGGGNAGGDGADGYIIVREYY